MTNETVYLLMPEIILVLAATLVYVGGAFLPERAGWSWLSAATIVLAGVALYRQVGSQPGQVELDGGLLSGPLVADLFSIVLRSGILGTGLIFVLLAARWSENGESSEFMGSLLMILAGLMLVSLAGDLILFFVGLELVSIPTYVILYLGRGKNLLESGTKYFFLSILSSALMLYGFSFLYGAAGSTSLAEIRRALAMVDPAAPGVAAFAPLALVLIFAGLGFRITAVPFHFYAPDVYQGTSNPNAGLLAVVPKIAGLVALVRIAYVAMPGLEGYGWQLSLVLAMVTMSLGNLLALWQTNVRRLMAYSSIAHAGYMLIGLAVGFAVLDGASQVKDFDGVGATLFYLLVYSAASAGVFAVLTYLGSPRRPVDKVDDLDGLATHYPKSAAALALFMFSLTGLPPLAGFWGKFTLFTGALGVDANTEREENLWSWFLALAIVGALNAAISAAYYLRIVAAMYFRPVINKPDGRGGVGAGLAVAVCSLLVLAIGCYPGPWVEQTQRASQAARITFTQVPAPVAKSSPPPSMDANAERPPPPTVRAAVVSH